MLSESLSNKGILDTMKLARKLAATTPPTTRLAFAAGMMMAMNMPYRAWQGDRHGPVGVEGVQRARLTDADAEDFVRDAEAHQQAVAIAGGGVEFLAQGAAHEEIAHVGYQDDESHLQIGRANRDDREFRVFPGGGVVQYAGEEPLERGEPGFFGHYPQGKGHGEVSGGDGDAVP